jgi:hypothetical protein
MSEPPPSAGREPAAFRWSSPTLWIGVAILAGLAALLVYMLNQLGSAEPRWSRLVYLFGSVEAIAFAAVGAFFGTQVQRERVADAEHRARDAEVKADANVEDAVQGRTLSKAVKAKAIVAAPDVAQYGFSPQPGMQLPAEAAGLLELATLAEQLFPEES